ncbi:MAG TPA: hypothetical protein VIM11_04415 [Tepidisphaeraceae bacterium]|jgi:hypothetical protein
MITSRFIMHVTISLNPDHEKRLQRRAAAAGKDVSAYIEQLVDKELAATQSSDDSTPNQRVVAWDRWVTVMRQWGVEHLPEGHVIDDSRETIYDGRE